MVRYRNAFYIEYRGIVPYSAVRKPLLHSEKPVTIKITVIDVMWLVSFCIVSPRNQLRGETMQSGELMDCDVLRRLNGGTKPINPATLYRNIRAGRYPKPIKVGPGSS
jgi:hypothetical protein